MKTLGSATTFHVADLETAMRFYAEVLGFTARIRFGDYGGVQHGEVQIHLSGPQATNKKAVGQGGLYIFVDDVDGYYAHITAKGARTQAPPKTYEYGMRDFVIEDPDGNLVAVGQEAGGGERAGPGA